MAMLRFDIRFPDGRREVTVVDGARALVGSAAHCDIRMPMDQAAYEHLYVEQVGGQVRVEARAVEPPTTLNGMPFQSGTVNSESQVGVGNVRMYLSLSDMAGGAAVVKKKSDTSPMVKILGLVALPALLYLALDDSTAAMPGAPEKLPELFVEAATACPQQAPDQALAMANEKIAVAEGKRERHPFAPHDGIEAVALYDIATACYKRAEHPKEAAESAAAAKSLRDAIVMDFRARRVRLEHSLKVEDWELAKKDVRVLRALTEGKKGDYVTWLSTTYQQLRQRTGTPQ